MNYTVESKSQLAKLMATENINIVHQKISTAKFDVKNRTLYLPIWQDMSGAMYDLLCGHEVGHALFTPMEGWHDVVKTNERKNFKSFLNVVEDARIEKKIKRRYPGLKTPFQSAYKELMNRDFFGIKNRDINSLKFIDRLNIFSKSQYSMDISFTDVEHDLIDKVESCETWEDVLEVTNEIYEYSKSEIDEDDDFDSDDSDSDDTSDDTSSDDGSESDSDDNSDDGSESDSETKKSDDSDDNVGANKSKESDKPDDSDDKEEVEKTTTNRNKESIDSFGNQFSPNCETDDTYRDKQNSLLDESCKEYVYMDIPEPIFEKIITPAKRVHELLQDYYFPNVVSVEQANNFVVEFKNKNERYISLLAKEFEMRKAANAYSKAKVSDTGDIDISKLASYKFDDNIFRKSTFIPKGKNHGLILLLDKSGSMSDNLSGSIEQILVLTMFCRKVNIPFVVYGFGNATDSYMIDHKKTFKESVYEGTFSTNEGELFLSSVRLREYLNSKMSNSEFTNAIRNMIVYKKSYERNSRIFYKHPESENLSSTPLISAIFACGFLMKKFRKQYNLEKSSLVIVNDGDSDCISQYNIKDELENINQKRFSTYSQNVILRDKKHKLEFNLSLNSEDYDRNSESIYDVSIKWFKKVSDSKVFGFFILPTFNRGIKDAIYRRYCYKDGVSIRKTHGYNSKEIVNILHKQLKSEKFLESKYSAYDSFYLISGGDDLNTENEQIEIEGKVTSSKLKNAFVKMNKKRVVNRVLVSKFVQNFAA